MSKRQTEALKTILKGGNPADGTQIPTSKENMPVPGPSFPTDPDKGDTYTAPDGKEYEYTGSGWVSDNRTTEFEGTPFLCPECEKPMAHRNDTKMYRIYGMCFDCRIQKETKLRAKGEWELFEKRKVLENMRDWLEDQWAELENFEAEGFAKEEQVLQSGEVMEWSGPQSMEELVDEYREWLEKHEEAADKLEEEVRELERSS
jgi:hypothetical protein